MAIAPLDDFKRFPKMVHWFNPVLLARLLNNVITSAMFGKYADRRLMMAALDNVTPDEHKSRAQKLRSEGKLPETGPVWFDFVADLGDGFDSTYAVASLLAADQLNLDGPLPRGKLLLMGGDEVYPLAEPQTYRNQLVQPYKWAFPDHNRASDDGVPLYAIPGNHDWYDGLVLFSTFFLREKPTHFGSWRSRQRRSYFAIQLTANWWIWAIDIQLAEDMDQPQADYFTGMAKIMGENDRIILCSAEPGWLYTDTNTASWGIMDFALGIAKKSGKGLSVPILLSGDTHHYSRYVADDGTQFITSGGGGAFLHPTHQLEEAADIKWNGTKKTLRLGTKGETQRPAAESQANAAQAVVNPAPQQASIPKEVPNAGGKWSEETAAVYPSMDVSRRLIWKNFRFARTNFDFSILMGAIYFIVGIAVGLRDQWDVYIIVTLLLGYAIMSYTVDQEKVAPFKAWKAWRNLPKPKEGEGQNTKLDREATVKQLRKAVIVTVASVLHIAAHAVAILGAAHYFTEFNNRTFVLTGEWWYVWKWLAILAIEMGVAGALIGSTIFGWNMMFTGRFLRMNRNDSFSAIRIGQYNNFLRISIDGDEVKIYAIGLNDVPERDDWVDNPKMKEPGQPHFIPRQGKELAPHLIEKIVIAGPYKPA